jgi:hypothetical protein
MMMKKVILIMIIWYNSLLLIMKITELQNWSENFTNIANNIYGVIMIVTDEILLHYSTN